MIRVLGSRVIIELDKEVKNESKLIIVQDNKEPKCEGTVVAVGKGTRLQDGTLIPVDVEIGEHVIISRMAGAPLIYDGRGLLVINERDIIGIVEKEEAGA